MGGVRNQAGVRTVTIAVLGMALTVGLIAGPSGASGDTMPPIGVVDLVVGFVSEPNPAAAGSSVQLESIVSNVGTLVAERVVSTIEISAIRVAAEAGSGSCTAVGSTRLEIDGSAVDQPWTVTCDLGALPPGAETRVAFSVTTGPSGTHLAGVAVSSNQADARPSNNEAQIPIYVLPAAPGIIPAFQQPGRLNPYSRATV